MILDNQQVTVNVVSHHLCISHGSAQGIIQDRLQFHKIRARWFPKQLTGESKCNHLTICQGLLNCYRNEADVF
jgi:hypothetical protein